MGTVPIKVLLLLQLQQGAEFRSWPERRPSVCCHKVFSEKPTPWLSSIEDQLCELERERRKAERRWFKSKLIVHKQIYDVHQTEHFRPS